MRVFLPVFLCISGSVKWSGKNGYNLSSDLFQTWIAPWIPENNPLFKCAEILLI